MKLFERFFGRSDPPENNPSGSDEPIVIVPIPPLVTTLFRLEKEKGSPLSEEEVLAARDSAVCMTMTARHRDQLADKRGYDDINPDNVWVEWQAARLAESD